MRSIYRRLRASLTWVGDRTVTWKFIDELVAVIFEAIIARSMEFAPALEDMRLSGT